MLKTLPRVEEASSASTSYAIREPDLYRMGSAVALDGRVSWAPKLPGRYQPINCYVAIEGDHAYLIDTGVPAHRQAVVSQLQALLPKGMPLTVSMTRSELDCSGNLGAIHASLGIDQLIAPGLRNPFDAYDEVSRSVSVPAKRQKLASVTSAINPLGESKRLLLIPARFRILTTYWLYDTETKTMFTTDIFGHTSIAGPDAPVAIDPSSLDESTLDSVQDHILQKFGWLTMAHTGEIKGWLTKIFTDYDVEIIAPTHGCILRGKPVVERHFDLLMGVLSRLDRGAAETQKAKAAS